MQAKDDPIGRWRSKNAIEQITAEAVNDLAKKIASKEAQRSLEDIITERADKVTSDNIQTFLRMRDIRIVPTKAHEAVEMLYKLNKESMRPWTHEELLTLVAYTYSLIAAGQLQSELI
jgi:hypothetical protein